METFFQQFALIGPPLLLAMVAHEYAHGYAALKQGDPTAYQLGRLTLNPIKHIDPFMSIILPAVLIYMGGPVIGGAKPVPVNPRNYRNYKRGDIIVSLAGVATNLVIAVASVPLIMLVGWLGEQLPGMVRPLAVLQHMLAAGILINLILAFFNLIPIPPLDGSHVFKYLLPPRLALAYQNVGRYGLFILFAIISFASSILLLWLSPAFLLVELARKLYLPLMLPSPFSS